MQQTERNALSVAAQSEYFVKNIVLIMPVVSSASLHFYVDVVDPYQI
jgi:hypothetical protein